MGTVAAIIIRRERDLVAHFQQERAVSAAKAKSLTALRIDDGTPLRRLRERAVIREAAPGTFYLDEPSWIALGRTRRRTMTVLLVIVLLLGLTAVIATRSQGGH